MHVWYKKPQARFCVIKKFCPALDGVVLRISPNTNGVINATTIGEPEIVRHVCHVIKYDFYRAMHIVQSKSAVLLS